MSVDYLIGVDLGQAQDYTALCVLERARRDTGRTERTLGGTSLAFRMVEHPQHENVYSVRHLERLPLGTPYPAQVERVVRLHADVAALTKDRVDRTQPQLVVDQTGVGRPVVDMLRKAGLKSLNAVTITAGDTASRDGREHRVPKRELVSVLQVLLQTDRLGIADSLDHAVTLTKELLAFKVKFSDKGHDTYGNDWRENPHDDMVLAVALATWAGERLAWPGMVRY